MGHADLLRALLPPVSYDASGPVVGAQLDAEGAALDQALVVSVRAAMGIHPLMAHDWLPDWERVYGLPNDCLGTAPLLQERLAALATAVLERGGLSREWFTRFAALFGYTITFREYMPFRVGRSRVGDALTSGGWQYAWAVRAPAVTVRRFRVGRSCVGEPLAAWGDDVLECLIRRYAPAHTLVRFTYG